MSSLQRRLAAEVCLVFSFGRKTNFTEKKPMETTTGNLLYKILLQNDRQPFVQKNKKQTY